MAAWAVHLAAVWAAALVARQGVVWAALAQAARPVRAKAWAAVHLQTPAALTAPATPTPDPHHAQPNRPDASLRSLQRCRGVITTPNFNTESNNNRQTPSYA